MKRLLLFAAAGLLLGAPAISAATDSFGYRSVQTDEPGAVDYIFQDISTTGTELALAGAANDPLGRDDGTAVLDLGFAFPTYGSRYNRLLVSVNGYLTSDLDRDAIDSSNDEDLPQTPSSGGGMRIYVLHDDLVLNNDAAIYTQFFPQGLANYPVNPGVAVEVIQWNEVSYFGDSDDQTFSFQALLFRDGTMHFVYEGDPENGGRSTTGIQNEDATIGLTVQANTANTIPDNSTVTIFPPITTATPQLVIEDIEVTSTANGVNRVRLTFEAEAGKTYAISSGEAPNSLALDTAFSVVGGAPAGTQAMERVFAIGSGAEKLFFQVSEQ